MSYQYFACDWIITTPVFLSAVAKAADQIHAHPVILRSKLNLDGFMTLTFGIRVDKESDLEIFNQLIGDVLNTGHWYPITEELFGQEKSIMEWLRTSDGPEFGAVLDAMIRHTIHNENLEERLKNTGKNNIYRGVEWTLLPHQLALFPDAIARITERDGGLHILLHSRKNELGHNICILGIRVISIADLEMFMTSIGYALGLGHHYPIDEKQYYWGCRFTDSGFLRIKDYVEYSRKIAEENERIINST
jgi:hypothetical protein